MSTPLQVIVRVPASYVQAGEHVAVLNALLLSTRAWDRTSLTIWLAATALPNAVCGSVASALRNASATESRA